MQTIEELMAEKEQIRSRLAGTDEMSADDVDAAEARVKDIDAEMEEVRKANEASVAKRAALVDSIRKADEAGELRTVSAMPANGAQGGSIHETTDISASGKLYERAWVKDMAERGGVSIGADSKMTAAERTAFTALTTNTAAVVPMSIQTRIWDLVTSGNAVYGDLTIDNFRGVYEFLRHTAIAAGDAAKVAENTAAADEQNTITAITISGDEFRKSAKISRKMAVQSFNGFEDWLVREVGNRMGNVLDVYAIAELSDATLGMDATNKALTTATSGSLTIADVRKLLAAIKCDADGYGASKGRVIYANSATIWNYIAAVSYTTGESAFMTDVMTSDPITQGRIYGVPVKLDENIADGVIYAGYPGCVSANLFDGIDITPFIDPTTQEHSYNGYACFGMGVAVPKSFAKLTIAVA